MPRTQLVAQPITDAGVLLTFAAANAQGHWVLPGDIVYVKNGGASPINVTIQTGQTAYGKAIADTVVVVPNASERVIGDLSSEPYEVPDGPDQGHVLIDLSAVASVTIGAFRP